MIHIIKAPNAHGISNTIGEHDTIKNRLRMFYARSRMRRPMEIEVYDVDIPEGVNNVELVDLDTDHRFVAELDYFAEAPRVDGKVTLNVEDLTKIR